MLQDARDYQILFLSGFLILGIATRDWTLQFDLMAVVFFTCLLTQALATWYFHRPSNPSYSEIFASLKSAVITSLSLCLLLRADSYFTMLIAANLAILSKFFIKFQGKHFFNPANFGIISALILRPDAWVSPGQWGDDWWYGLLFFGGGSLILKKVGRWDTTVAFLLTYSCLEAVRNVWLGWTWDVFLHRLMSGSLLLFALFMITDPRSIPNARVSRLIWAALIAIFTFILRNQFFVSEAVFWALFAVAPLTILLNFIWPASDFSWLQTTNLESLSVAKDEEPLGIAQHTI
ncbi:RnfABCDGE type electron transport complex subunit D [Ancylothrix sp. C2]|nr:RnfABCDGE type electron transport complex subunit D [Ancylothrix sp. D3o]